MEKRPPGSFVQATLSVMNRDISVVCAAQGPFPTTPQSCISSERAFVKGLPNNNNDLFVWCNVNGGHRS
ncbi:hypothetical protein PsYK624_029410 [Phanerochaete sordida]|uniref:Uncharacterized protein n=1 Tax=Phanerochaete sordida TaxID=48140 RepID=A0A9P3G240_9APHY|nr:hypothetical protein PsYK624_029410 [Phanerochaete sordida]